MRKKGKAKEGIYTLNRDVLYDLVKSWTITEGTLYTTDSILSWIKERNDTVGVDIKKIGLSSSQSWFYDELNGTIHNQNNSFFSIFGFKKTLSDGCVISQPMIRQEEIGFLGILCKKIDGILYFLMQAKIEPGNINNIQISPTIQATKSNFTQKHGGAKPPYLEFFKNADQYEIIVDQIQSEQSSRFYKKRNRNIMICVDKDVPVLPSHRWMTLGQVKSLMRIDNLVNMDTRTVLSCIPFYKLGLTQEEQVSLSRHFTDRALFRSVFLSQPQNFIPNIYHFINDYKMFQEEKEEAVPLNELKDWRMTDCSIECKRPYPYRVIYCDIAIEGREVKQWTQPLFEAMGIATFGLICSEQDGVLKFLVRATSELGCFDGLELGPTVQREAVPMPDHKETEIDRFFFERLAQGKGVFFDHLLSEEGGRFYHEQNRNVLMQINIGEIPQLPKGYFWVDYRTLNELVQVNNTLNIQLRNLISLLEA